MARGRDSRAIFGPRSLDHLASRLLLPLRQTAHQAPEPTNRPISPAENASALRLTPSTVMDVLGPGVRARAAWLCSREPTAPVREIGRRRRRVVFDVHQNRQYPQRASPSPWHPATETTSKPVWRTTATTARFPEAVRENEEVVPVNAVSTWVLPSGVTVGR